MTLASFTRNIGANNGKSNSIRHSNHSDEAGSFKTYTPAGRRYIVMTVLVMCMSTSCGRKATCWGTFTNTKWRPRNSSSRCQFTFFESTPEEIIVVTHLLDFYAKKESCIRRAPRTLPSKMDVLNVYIVRWWRRLESCFTTTLWNQNGGRGL